MRRTSLIVVLLSIVCTAGAVVATPYPVEKRLPDGSVQKVYIRGDEHHHYLTYLDGTVIPGTEVGTLASEEHTAHRYAPSRVQLSSSVPNKGTVHIPVILVNFTDLSFTLPNAREQLSDLYNGKGGSNPNTTRAASPHPTYITTPAVTDVKNLTESSFTAYWEPQEDAVSYFVTLYSISPVSSNEEETFETFTTIENIQAAGWESNFARLTNAVSEKKYAVLFSQSGECTWCPRPIWNRL